MASEPTIPPPEPLIELAGSPACFDGRLRLRWTDLRGIRNVEIGRTTVLGSSENAGVTVANPTVSRVHAELELDAKGVWIRDLGSRNGTFVDQVEVKSARLHSGQTLRLGSAEIRVEWDPERARTTSALWPEDHFGQLIGKSEAMRELFATLDQVARTDIPVLVRGETGSGKELVARAIHEASPRASRPYVVVDCAALAESLLESELFGHARGAFTGATGVREGAFEAANGGTVFLDEIGELPLEMQPKLLRVLEQKTVRRLGETNERPVDVRFITATHRDLVDFVSRGWFREDLYFRFAVLPVRVPPLRERMEDLPLLARHFLGQDAGTLGPNVLALLAARPWRGNVRELRNVLMRARALGIDRALAKEEEDRPIVSSGTGTHPRHRDRGGPPSDDVAFAGSGVALAPDVFVPPHLLDLAHREFRERWGEIGERAYLQRKLAKHANNVSKVSREIELARTYTHKLMKKHGL